MKTNVILILFLLFISACTQVSRPYDTVKPKSDIIPCDQNNNYQCPEGYSCNIFKDYENKPVCWPGYEPCDRCPSKRCDIMESFPPQIVCK